MLASVFKSIAPSCRTVVTGARFLSSVKRPHPYVFTDLPSGETQVRFPNNSVPLGTFPTELKSQIKQGFTLEPNPRTEPEILVQKPSVFKENPEFWPLAGELIKNNIHLDPEYNDLVAGETLTKYFHIYDFRLPPLFGRIPEVEDILGTVELDLAPDATKIVPYSFEPNAMYRPVTQYGATLVSPFLFKLLSENLGKSQ